MSQFSTNTAIFIISSARQDESFENLVEGLFPANNALDSAAREALSYEAQQMYLWLDKLRDEAKDQNLNVIRLIISRFPLLIIFQHIS